MSIPKKKDGEKPTEYLKRCMVELKSYNDYPKGATNNAKKAIAYKEKNGSSCGTKVGWTRARQLANGENLSSTKSKPLFVARMPMLPPGPCNM